MEFTPWLSNVNLVVEKGSANCSSFKIYFWDMGVYKANTTNDLHSFASLNDVTSQKLINNFSKLYKKENLIANYTRSYQVIPTTGTTYAYGTILTLTGLTVGKKYRLKTPTYLNIDSGTSSAASFVYLDNTLIREFYSNTTSANLYLQFQHDFIATATSMNLRSYSRYSRGIQTDMNGQIAIDLYEVIE